MIICTQVWDSLIWGKKVLSGKEKIYEKVNATYGDISGYGNWFI